MHSLGVSMSHSVASSREPLKRNAFSWKGIALTRVSRLLSMVDYCSNRSSLSFVQTLNHLEDYCSNRSDIFDLAATELLVPLCSPRKEAWIIFEAGMIRVGVTANNYGFGIPLLTAVIFISYVGTGGMLTLSRVFTVFSLALGVRKTTLSYLVKYLFDVTEAFVANRRLQVHRELVLCLEQQSIHETVPNYVTTRIHFIFRGRLSFIYFERLSIRESKKLRNTQYVVHV